MNEMERLNNVVTRFQLIVNGLTFVMGDPAKSLENDALAMRLKTAMRDLIRHEVLHEERTIQEDTRVPITNAQS